MNARASLSADELNALAREKRAVTCGAYVARPDIEAIRRDQQKWLAKKSKKSKPTPPNTTPKRRRKANETFWECLQSLGFNSYSEYLQSTLWAGIRHRVLKQRRICVKCHSRADQVHHSQYDSATMRGETLKHLYPVCRKCHEAASVANGVKVTVVEANAYLGIRIVRTRKTPDRASSPNMPRPEIPLPEGLGT